MDHVELSDLEEGEILENENDSLSNLSESWSDEFGSPQNHFELIDKSKSKKYRYKENKTNVLHSSESYGYKNSTKKCKLSGGSGNKSNLNIIDLGLEEVSSDGDCLSDDGRKQSSGDLDYKSNKEKRSQFCGTVEDIMSEIGETICRKKSHCPHRKRRSKHNFDRHKDNYSLWRHKTSHAKVKKPRRRISSDNSNSDELFMQERKRKKRSSYVIEETIKKPKIRDFDEVRQTLLEKLKQKQAEEAKTRVENLLKNFTPAEEEVENSDIQEVEMGIDNTNYVDNPTADSLNVNNVTYETDKDKNKEDDNLFDDDDLIELRLAALESNSKQRATSVNQVKGKNKVQNEGENGRSDDVDLDRNELLLRAEALKTALLKKHQRGLKKSKMSDGTNISNNNNFLNTFLPLKVEKPCDEKPSTSSISNVENTEKNVQKDVENERNENAAEKVKVSTATSPISSLNPKKVKSKRKKRKSDSMQNNAKENTENADILEEDDRTLRMQLIRDLLRKKSLKDSDKKPILTDSVQTSANQLPVISGEQEEEGKPLATVPKKQKVNAGNTTKPTAVPRIPKPEINRIIVHLGSEDSSDENDAEENSTLKARENKEENVLTKESNESVRANYEKSVDLLLSQTWQKIEGEIAAARNAQDTPEAVYKHLPLSERLEYIRLKQKIAERERLKKMKENSGKSSSGPPKQDSSSQGGTFIRNVASAKESKVSESENSKLHVALQGTGVNNKNVPLNSKNFRNLNQVTAKEKTFANSKVNISKCDRKYIAPLNGINVKQTNQRRSLLQSSQVLITKLKLLLKKIKIEKTIEENYEKEIAKLKNQINLFEKRKLEQKFKIKKLAEESSKTYKVIQQITNLGKKPKEETAVNKDSVSEDAKNKEIVKAEEESKTDEMVKAAEESKNDISKGKTSQELDKPENENENVCLPIAGLLDYSSPLQVFNKVSDDSGRVDPNVMVCQFDLMGVCKDKECTYQHFRNAQNLQCVPVVGKPDLEELNGSK